AGLEGEEQVIGEGLADSGAEAEDLNEAFAAAAAALAESEALSAAVTAERAEAAAARTQLERSIRELGERRMRLDRQLQDAVAELEMIGESLSGLDDPALKREAVEGAEHALETAGFEAEEVEAGLAAARSAEMLARGPVDAARSRVNGLEAEARTIAKILASGEAAGDFPPVAEAIRV